MIFLYSDSTGLSYTMRFGSDYTQDLTQFTYLPYTFDGPQVKEYNFLGPGNKKYPWEKKDYRGKKQCPLTMRPCGFFYYLSYTFDGPQVCENNFLGPGNKHIPVGKKGGRGNKKMTMGRR